MKSTAQTPDKQWSKNAGSQQSPSIRVINPSKLIAEFEPPSEMESPEERCAIAHYTGEMLKNGYRGDEQ